MANGPLGPGRGSASGQASAVFSHHEVKEIARAEGEEVRLEVGKPAARNGLDHGTVEQLPGQAV